MHCTSVTSVSQWLAWMKKAGNSSSGCLRISLNGVKSDAFTSHSKRTLADSDSSGLLERRVGNQSARVILPHPLDVHV